MKRAFSAFSLLISLMTPALAQSGQPWHPEAPTWSADLHKQEGDAYYSTRLLFTKVKDGWRVTAECEVGNVRSRTHNVFKGQGVMRMSEGHALRGRLGDLGQTYVDRDTVLFASGVCVSGPYNRGTAD